MSNLVSSRRCWRPLPGTIRTLANIIRRQPANKTPLSPIQDPLHRKHNMFSRATVCLQTAVNTTEATNSDMDLDSITLWWRGKRTSFVASNSQKMRLSRRRSTIRTRHKPRNKQEERRQLWAYRWSMIDFVIRFAHSWRSSAHCTNFKILNTECKGCIS